MNLRLRRLDRVFVRHAIYFITACTHQRRCLLANDLVQASFVDFARRGVARGAFVGRYVLMPDHLHFFVAFDDRFVAAVYDRRTVDGNPAVAGRADDSAVIDRSEGSAVIDRGEGSAVIDRSEGSAVIDRGEGSAVIDRGEGPAVIDRGEGPAVIDRRYSALSQWMKSLKNALSKTLRLGGQAAPHWQKGFFDHVLRSAESYAEKWDYVRENPVRAALVERAEDWPWAGEIEHLDADSERL